MTASADPNTVDGAMRAHVAARLARVEADHGVRVLYAAESGSRAWGFGSPDSDYDVRFIYAHPVRWYLTLDPGRDVIEAPLDDRLVDLAGWDVRKALALALRSNPAFYEWLVSPIVYRDDGHFRESARGLFERHWTPAALAHHYWSIARGQYAREMEGRDAVKLKKYFYCVRPLLSLAWVTTRLSPPPMQIRELLETDSLPPEIRSIVTDLIEAKRTTPELGLAPRVRALDDWIEGGLARLKPAERTPHTSPTAAAEAEALFHAAIGFRE